MPDDFASRFDSYASILGPLGRPHSFGTLGTDIAAQVGLGVAAYGELSRLYVTSGIAARIVDMPSDDAVARGFRLDDEEENSDQDLKSELDRLRVGPLCADGIRWSRLYGASLLVLLIKDGGLWEEPLNEGSIDRIEKILAYESFDIKVESFYSDPSQENFGEPETYRLISPDSRKFFIVHESRTIRISGDPLPRYARQWTNVPWQGRSALFIARKSLLDYINAINWATLLLERKQQPIYSMAGLADLIKTPEGVERARGQVRLVDECRSTMNTVMLNGGTTTNTTKDDYKILDLSLGGVKDVIEQVELKLCADTGIPATKLFGRSPAGMNSTGEADQEGYYQLVSSIQRNDLAPALNRIYTLIFAQKSYRGKKRTDFEICFNPMWLPSEKEQAETKWKLAQASFQDAQSAIGFIEIGVISQQDMRNHLVDEGKYGLTSKTLPPPPDLAVAVDPRNPDRALVNALKPNVGQPAPANPPPQ